MIQHTAFADALDAAEHLDPDAQVELIAVLNRRLAERARERIATTVEQARREFASGQSKPMTADEIVREALS
jgi:ribosomal protein S4